MKYYDAIDVNAAYAFNISPDKLHDHTRHARIASARFIAYTLRSENGETVEEIATVYNKSPESVRYGLRKSRELEKYDSTYRQRITSARSSCIEGFTPYTANKLTLGAVVRTRISSTGEYFIGRVVDMSDLSFRVEQFDNPDFSTTHFRDSGRQFMEMETSLDIILIK